MTTPPSKRKLPNTSKPLAAKMVEDFHGALEEVFSSKRTVYSILYGDPGSGKTYQAARLGTSNLLYTTERSGGDSLLVNPQLFNSTKKLVFDPTAGWDALEPIMQGINNKQLLINGMPIDNLMLDNLTGMQRRVLQRVRSEKNFKREDIDLTSQQDFYATLNLMSPLLYELEQCRANVTLICSARYPDAKEVARGIKTRPSLPQSIWDVVNEAAAVVGYLHTDTKGNRVIRIRESNTISAKARIFSEVAEKTPVISVDQFTNLINNYQNGTL